MTGLWAAPAFAQIYVYPRRPTQTNVRYFDFHWKYIDILLGPEAPRDPTRELGPRLHQHAFSAPGPGTSWSWVPHPGDGNGVEGAGGTMLRAQGQPPAGVQPPPADSPPAGDQPPPAGPTPRGVPEGEEAAAEPGEKVPAEALPADTGGVRLYFYEAERPIAQRAAAYIADAYRYLARQFRFVPRETFPYFLYNTYFEFLQTNLFPVQEGVLGVTSPQSLEIALPYFGDHRKFQDVSTHELAHEFTVQKVRAVAKDLELDGSPLYRLPLWFIEGLAEFYAKGGLDPEGSMLVRDLIVNPHVEIGHVFTGFFEERRFNVLWTYKLGQARVTFLEEVYGEGTIQKILEQSPRLMARVGEDPAVDNFAELVSEVTGDEPRTIAVKFAEWVKRRAYRAYLDADQDAAAVRVPRNAPDDFIQTMASSPEGHLLLYRTIDRSTGQRTLELVDVREIDDGVTVAADMSPGIVSLHPTLGRTFALGEDRLVFIARDGASDVIYWQAFERELEKDGKGKVVDVEIDLGARRRFDLGREGLLAAESPSLSPAGDRVVFVGIDTDGQKDLFILEPASGDDYRLVRLTRTEYAERHTSWGPGGIVFAADATSHGHFNLFRVDPAEPGEVTRLTTEAEDQFDPLALAADRVVFAMYDELGANLYEWTPDGVRRLTAVSTGLFDVGPGPEGSLWTLYYRGGERQPAKVPPESLLRRPMSETAVADPPDPLPSRALDGARDYEAVDLSNWEPGNIFALFGASSNGVFGQVIASAHDLLRNHQVVLTLFAFGEFDRIDGQIFYFNQKHRTLWGVGLFHDLRFHVDTTFEDERLPDFITDEQFFGAAGLVRYPFSQFLFTQAELRLGGVQYEIDDPIRDFLASPEDNPAGENLLPAWDEANAGLRFQTEASLAFGYNTLRYHYLAGPIAGSSVLLEGTVAAQPFDGVRYETIRLDAEHYFPLLGRSNFLLRGGGGTTFGDRQARQFYLYSFDTLRGVPFGDVDFLLGREYFFTTAELQFPLNAIVRITAIDLEGIIGVDFGGVGQSFDDLWDHRVLDLALGLNFGLGPIVLRLHYAKPFDIGAIAVPNGGDWVTNLSLGWRY